VILTDGIHLVSDESKQELYDFAKRMGLKECWFHRKGYLSHYDLTSESKVKKAISMGAVFVKGKDLIIALRKMRVIESGQPEIRKAR